MNDKDKDMEYNYGSDADEAEVKAKKKKYTKSFYIIFALCLCAIGVAGFYTYSDVADYMNKAKNPSITQTASEPQNKQAEAKVDGVTKSTQPTDSPTQPTEKETEQPTEPPTQQAAKVSPVGDNPEVIQPTSWFILKHLRTGVFTQAQTSVQTKTAKFTPWQTARLLRFFQVICTATGFNWNLATALPPTTLA